MTPNQPTPSNGADALKQFQLAPLSPKRKAESSFGLSIAKLIDSTLGNSNGYYYLRNVRFKANRDWASGRMDTYQKFADRMGFNGKVNYSNINWNSVMIVNRIVSGLVGTWMGRGEKINVTAVDALSVKDKQEQYEEAEFLLYNRDAVENLQKQSGVQMIPPDQFVPEDQDELDLWQSEYQRLPEEILFEKGSNDVLASNGWFDVLKEKVLHDSAVTGLIGTETWMDESGVIHVEYIRPENIIYSYSEFPDFRDTTYRGRVKSLKISELRRKYGRESGGKLSEKELFDIAQTSKDYQLSDKITWTVAWEGTFDRPYDEFNVDVIVFEFRTVDTDEYHMKVTKNGGLIISSDPEYVNGDTTTTKTDKWNIYRGVYIRGTETMLEWGIKRNMIRPQDPTESGDAEFSFSFYMYQNQGMRNIAIPEKIEEPVEQMILARLKIQQLVAKMKPAGSAVNWNAVQNVMLGVVDGKPIDVKKVYEQTGDLYYNGVDAEGNQIPVPITELTNAGFLAQLQGLIELYRYHYEVLKDELGEDPNLMAQAAKPRVAVQNIQTSRAQAEASTDYMYDAYLYLMEITGKKIACLLNDSVKYGASAYRKLMRQEDVKDRFFHTRINMLPTEQELMQLDAMLAEAIAANKDILLYLDPFKIKRIAKEDVKLGELYFRQAMKRMLKSQLQQAQMQMEQNAQVQIASAQSKAQGDMQLKQFDVQKSQITADAQNKNTLLAGFMAMYQQGIAIPAELKQVEQLLIQNVAIPALMQNQQNAQAIAQSMQPPQEEQQQQNLPPAA